MIEDTASQKSISRKKNLSHPAKSCCISPEIPCLKKISFT
ncbi:hypothetical protein G5S_1033 [Chlamydia pecorum E58]|uniref:Uncharacterized protein n=1 Tax=Chlamydia pecorum (strain ATCC VR-628 / DSM 29919 / E58) TaxID=331635 RepID=A0AA34RE42_CHLPE|nr:hypothetical protein G5S_1033 [Chlamydia pecorum E58]